MNNPSNWELDRFLEDITGKKSIKLSWTVPKWQKDKFKICDCGVFRVGKDRRNKNILNGRKKLEAGIYAVGKIISLPHLKEKEDLWDLKYNINKDSTYLKGKYCIDLQITCNLVETPIIFDKIREIKEIKEDKYLIRGFQSATIPLSEEAFHRILEFIKRKQIDFLVADRKIENILTGEEKDTIIKIRIGHSQYKELLQRENSCCPVCGLKNKRLLIASHIKPWSKSDEKEKVDVDNVFLFCHNHDYLFDKGHISFDNEGILLVSSRLGKEDKKILGLDRNTKLKLSEKKKEYLKWHREHIFKA